MQLRFETGELTGEDYVRAKLWLKASLKRCPLHPGGGCGLACHGSYERASPPGCRIARWYCKRGHCTFSLLPDCLCSHLSGTLEEVEVVVDGAEQARSQAVASEVHRPQIELPGALRWLRRRVAGVHEVLVIIKGLLPGVFGGCEPTLSGFRARLGVDRVLVALRDMAAPFLGDLPTPVGFCARHRRRSTPVGVVQQSVGTDVVDPGG